MPSISFRRVLSDVVFDEFFPVKRSFELDGRNVAREPVALLWPWPDDDVLDGDAVGRNIVLLWHRDLLTKQTNILQSIFSLSLNRGTWVENLGGRFFRRKGTTSQSFWRWRVTIGLCFIEFLLISFFLNFPGKVLFFYPVPPILTMCIEQYESMYLLIEIIMKCQIAWLDSLYFLYGVKLNTRYLKTRRYKNFFQYVYFCCLIMFRR